MQHLNAPWSSLLYGVDPGWTRASKITPRVIEGACWTGGGGLCLSWRLAGDCAIGRPADEGRRIMVIGHRGFADRCVDVLPPGSRCRESRLHTAGLCATPATAVRSLRLRDMLAVCCGTLVSPVDFLSSFDGITVPAACACRAVCYLSSRVGGGGDGGMIYPPPGRSPLSTVLAGCSCSCR